METLIGQVNAPGFAVETESYEGFDIGRLEVDLGFISVDVAIAALDDATAIFAIAFSSESSSSDVVKGGLDTASGAEPGILSRPAVGTLANALPPGFAALLAVDCSLFFEDIGESIQGCAGFAMSVSREEPDEDRQWGPGIRDRGSGAGGRGVDRGSGGSGRRHGP